MSLKKRRQLRPRSAVYFLNVRRQSLPSRKATARCDGGSHVIYLFVSLEAGNCYNSGICPRINNCTLLDGVILDGARAPSLRLGCRFNSAELGLSVPGKTPSKKHHTIR